MSHADLVGLLILGLAVAEFGCGFIVGRAFQRLRQRGEWPIGLGVLRGWFR